MKKIILAAFLAAIMLSTAASARNSRVFDQAGLFTSGQIEALEADIGVISAEIDMDVIILTTGDASGKTARKYADDFYTANNLDFNGDQSGVLYLIDLDNNELYIYTKGKAIRYFTDARIESTLDYIYDDAKNGDYYTSADGFLNRVVYYVNLGIPEGQYNYYEKSYAEKLLNPVLIIISFAAAAISGTVMFLAVKIKYSKAEKYKYPADMKNKLELTRQEDRLINRFITRVRIPRNNSPGGGSSGGRSTVHKSSGGGYHGGGGRKL